VDVTTVASRSDAHGSGEAPGWHSHTGTAEPRDVVTVDLDGCVVVTVVWLDADFFGVELHAPTSKATPATAIPRRKPARISNFPPTTANYLPRQHSCNRCQVGVVR
jgi:hypothetical protein